MACGRQASGLPGFPSPLALTPIPWTLFGDGKEGLGRGNQGREWNVMPKSLQQRGPFPIPGNGEDGAGELQVGAETLVLAHLWHTL